MPVPSPDADRRPGRWEAQADPGARNLPEGIVVGEGPRAGFRPSGLSPGDRRRPPGVLEEAASEEVPLASSHLLLLLRLHRHRGGPRRHLRPVPAGEILQVPDGFDAGFSARAASGGLAVLPEGAIARFDGASVVIDPADRLRLADPLHRRRSAGLRDLPPPLPRWRLALARAELPGRQHFPSLHLPAVPRSRREGSIQVVETVRFNYDLAFDSRGRPFVSAYDGVQMIVLVDGDPSTRPIRWWRTSPATRAPRLPGREALLRHGLLSTG